MSEQIIEALSFEIGGRGFFGVVNGNDMFFNKMRMTIEFE